jgi:hypothetical protein
LCIKRRSFEGELQIARNCHFLPLNADFTGNTLATEFLVSSARFHQKFWMRRVRIGGFKSTRIRSKKNLLPGREFFRSPIPPPGASFFARSALRSGVHAAEADYPRGCPPSKKRGRDLFDVPEKGSRLFPFGFGVFMRTPFCRAVAGCPRPETFFQKKIGRTVFVLPVMGGFARHDHKNPTPPRRANPRHPSSKPLWKGILPPE